MREEIARKKPRHQWLRVFRKGAAARRPTDDSILDAWRVRVWGILPQIGMVGITIVTDFGEERIIFQAKLLNVLRKQPIIEKIFNEVKVPRRISGAVVEPVSLH